MQGAAQLAQAQPAGRPGSRLGSMDGSSAYAGVFGSPAWEAATYALPSPAPSPLRATSREGGAATGSRAPRPATAGLAAAQRRPLAANQEQTRGAGRPATGGGKVAQQGSARTTPFAPRPNSSGLGSRAGAAGVWQRQQEVQSKGRRPRGNPLYDASSLQPLSIDGLLHCSRPGGGSHGAGYGVADMLSGYSSSRFYGGGGELGAGAPASFPVHEGDSHDWAAPQPGGSMRSVAAAAEALAAAPAGDCGPLDDLLLAVDRMLRQVERAID